MRAAVYSVSTKGGRAKWAAWWGDRPTRRRFVPPDARGEAVDEHAARQAVFAAFSRARGVTSWREIESVFAVAADRWARGLDPPFPGEKPRRAPDPGPRVDLPREALEVLGLEPPVTLEEAREAYRRRALEHHPDRGGSHDDMLAVNEAWEAVRRAFDGS